jgi:cytochrome c oxidase subunit IV
MWRCAVRRHATDLTSLVAGLVFVAIGVSYLVGVATDAQLEWRWVLPLALIVLGLAGLAGTVNLARNQRDQETGDDFPEPPPAAAPVGDDER